MFGYALNIPTESIDSFYTWKRFDEPLEDMEVEIILGSDCYVLDGVQRVRGWLLKVGVDPGFIEKLLDLIWTWPLLHYDLKTQRLTVPKRQLHPITPEPMDEMSFLDSKPVEMPDPFYPFPRRAAF